MHSASKRVLPSKFIAYHPFQLMTLLRRGKFPQMDMTWIPATSKTLISKVDIGLMVFVSKKV